MRGMKQLESILDENSISHVTMILNGVKPSKWRYYASKYASRYLYSYGYYNYGGYTGYGGYGGYGQDEEEE